MGEEIPGAYRLYRPEWVVMYATTRGPDDAEAELVARCEQVFTTRFEGRVRYEDVRYIVENHTKPWAIAKLEIRVPCMKGEFKYARDAQAHAGEQGWTDATLVPRNSSQDRDLRSYGVAKLS